MINIKGSKTMDAGGIVRLMIIERRLPKIIEAIDLIISLLLASIVQRGRISTREAEDAVLTFVSGEGYRVGALPGRRPEKAERDFRKVVEFGLISMKGEGRMPMTRPLLKDAGTGEQPKYGRKYKVYVPTEYARSFYDFVGHEERVTAIKGQFNPAYFGAEGPTNQEISRKYYMRDSKWRDFLLFMAKDRAECWCCGRDMRQLYGDEGWCVLDVHHLDALGKRPEPAPSAPDRVKLVCCSCHAVHHRTNIGIEELSERLRKRPQ